MHIRRFGSGDANALRQVFHSAVHKVASADYSQEQIQAWAPPSVDATLWRQHMENLNPFVATEDSEIVGYADIQRSGYIDHFYVSGYYPRRGIGTLLMHRLHEEALHLGVTTLTSDVSRTAQPFFTQFGFEVVEYKSKAIRGVVVPNALMRKELGAPSDTRIDTIDADGVALAAIQGLNAKLEERDRDVAELRAQVAELSEVIKHSRGD